MVSLGSCIGAVIVTYSDRHGITYEGLEVGLDWALAADPPHRIGRIAVEVRMPGPVTDEQIEILKRVANQCLIHNTLMHSPEMTVELRVGK